MTEQQMEDDIEIDLTGLFLMLMSHIRAILLAALICGLSAYGYSAYFITPQYESVSSIYMLTKETTLTSLADLQIGSQLTNDYRIIVTSRPVLQDVVDKLKLPYSYKTLKSRLAINNPSNTRILTITIQDPDPEMAKRLVDTVAMTASEYIGDVMELAPPKIIETGEVSTTKSGPDNRKNGLIGAAIGFVLICGVYVTLYLINDSIKTSEDVEKRLGITVLASVPLREDADRERDVKDLSSKKKSRFGFLRRAKTAADGKAKKDRAEKISTGKSIEGKVSAEKNSTGTNRSEKYKAGKNIEEKTKPEKTTPEKNTAEKYRSETYIAETYLEETNAEPDRAETNCGEKYREEAKEFFEKTVSEEPEACGRGRSRRRGSARVRSQGKAGQ